MHHHFFFVNANACVWCSVYTGLNGDVRYSIVGDAATSFGIGPINGSVYTTGALDREKVPVYTVVVMATDQAPDVRSRMSTTSTVCT